ncbi:dynamin family protein [Rothia sp. CCM 9418]|uniref:dynamin family protein n=1 Tax=Rothia sp. CCM 9418 TaxID=3402661 RepID=UPI003AE83F29
MPATRENHMTTLSARVDALNHAVEQGTGRVAPETLTYAQDVLDRTKRRRELSSEHTVVGFFGATGSGKSSLFNAVIGEDIARSAARRPTTSTAQAAIWGEEGSEQLLNWLEVEHRVVMDTHPEHAVQALNQADIPLSHGLWNKVRSAIGKSATEKRSGGLILLDLPDFDSVEKANRRIVERMAGCVDVLVWVFDPQKYADAVIHHEFIAPMAEHGAVMMAVMNQSDKLHAEEIPAVLDSLERLLAEDGLSRSFLSKPLAVSARTGYGIESLRGALGRVAAEKSAALERIDADLDAVHQKLGEYDGGGYPDGVTGTGVRLLDHALYEASGAPAVVKVAEKSYRLHASAHTGWIATRWMLKFKPDPLKRLNLHRAGEEKTLTRSSLPPMNETQKSVMSSGIRRFADGVSEGVGQPWSHSIREAARSRQEELPQALERCIATTDYQAQKKQWWWHLLNIVQWLALFSAVAGLLWLTVLACAGYFQLRLPAPPYVEGFPFPLPTLLVLTGIGLGLCVGLLGRFFSWIGQKFYARKVSRQIAGNIAHVSEEYIVDPVRSEVSRHALFCESLEQGQR